MASSIPHIFIAEDEEINRIVLQELFNDMPEEYVLEMAVDGIEAWEKLQQDTGKYDVILLDRMMPGMDGMEVLTKIKSHPELVQLPVIFQSALAAKEDISQGLKAGAHYYLTKPYDGDILHSVVQTALRDRFEYRRMLEELTEHHATMSCLDKANFSFRTVNEARNLGVLLANACKNTQKAIVGITELLVNAVEHGNLAIGYKEKSILTANGKLLDEIETRLKMDEYKSRIVSVDFKKTETQIEIVIADEGDGFDWRPFLTMSPERALDNHGRGIVMASLLSFDELEYMGRGNVVKAIINIGD